MNRDVGPQEAPSFLFLGGLVDRLVLPRDEAAPIELVVYLVPLDERRTHIPWAVCREPLQGAVPYSYVELRFNTAVYQFTDSPR
jgi:hypothetical protein